MKKAIATLALGIMLSIGTVSVAEAAPRPKLKTISVNKGINPHPLSTSIRIYR